MCAFVHVPILTQTLTLYLLLLSLLFCSTATTGAAHASRQNAKDAAPSPSPAVSILAFHITVDETQLPRLPRLLHRLYHQANLYLIDYHPSIPRTSFYSPAFYSSPNIHHRHALPYTPGGISVVLNSLDGIAFFLNRAEVLNVNRYAHSFADSLPFDYFITLTPDSYPTVPIGDMRTLLPHNPPFNFLHLHHASHLPLMTNDINHHYLDRTLTFNSSTALTSTKLYTRHLRHPDADRRNPPALPLAQPHTILSHALATHALSSPTAMQLLLTLAETSNPSLRFFPTLVARLPSSDVNPTITSASLHCTLRDADVDRPVLQKLPALDASSPPSLNMLLNNSRPCLFAAPFQDQGSLLIWDAIDRHLLIPPGKQGKPPGTPYHTIVRKRLNALVKQTIFPSRT